MKTLGSCCIALLVSLAVFPVQAVEDLRLYNDFEAEFIDVGKWTPVEVSGGLAGELVREIHGRPGSRRLHLIHRAYGNLGSDSGVVGGRNRILFPSQLFASITAIQATVSVKEFEVTGCAQNPEPTRARARISGFFFTLPNPRLLNNPRTAVLADVRIERRHDSIEDPPNVLRLFSLLFHCDDPDCFQGVVLDTLQLGTIEKGQSAELFIQWDQATRTWTARRDGLVEERVLLEAAPLGGARRLEISPNVANCFDSPRRVSYMEAFFDDVRIHPPPAP